jgi:hypothetical protein
LELPRAEYPCTSALSLQWTWLSADSAFAVDFSAGIIFYTQLDRIVDLKMGPGVLNALLQCRCGTLGFLRKLPAGRL